MLRRSVVLAQVTPPLLAPLKRFLGGIGYAASEYASIAQLLTTPVHADAVLVALTGEDQLCAVGQIRERYRTLPVIALAETSSEALAIAALRAGVSDYLKCPVSWKDLEAALRRAVPETPQIQGSGDGCRNAGLIGDSAVAAEVRRQIQRLAAIDSNVLITGETGTGKELVAQSIHLLSPRRKCPFLSINCAAIPDTLLESELFGYERGAFTGAAQTRAGVLEASADGTVFFDEIGDMSGYAQAKILRALERREITRLGSATAVPLRCRFIAATNRDLERSVAEGSFRKDLFFRLNVTRVEVPALRARKNDIPALCGQFLAEFNNHFGARVRELAPELLEFFGRYEWPGNIRELRNLMEAIFANSSSSVLGVDDIPDFFRRTLGHVVEAPGDERHRLLEALTSCKWNKSRAAEAMAWSRMTLYRKMAKYQITAPRAKTAAVTVTPE